MDATIARTLLDQIGRGNHLAISGGRWSITADGNLFLRVGCGYSVEIEYNYGRDTYTVHRVYTRGAKRWIKGTVADVYCDEIGDVAYIASCFRSHDFGPHLIAN